MYGEIAKYLGLNLPLQALRSKAGWYVGTTYENQPFSRESVEYYSSEQAALAAIASGDFTQNYI